MELPAAYEFRLPVGWEPVPVGGGAPNGRFVALCTETAASGFTANITLEGMLRPDLDTLPEIAEQAVTALRATSPDVGVASRGELGDPADPGFAQQLRMTTEVNGTTWDVTQAHVYLSARARDGAPEQTVLRAVLTCTVAQFSLVIADFDDFLSTLRFAPGA